MPRKRMKFHQLCKSGKRKRIHDETEYALLSDSGNEICVKAPESLLSNSEDEIGNKIPQERDLNLCTQMPNTTPSPVNVLSHDASSDTSDSNNSESCITDLDISDPHSQQCVDEGTSIASSLLAVHADVSAGSSRNLSEIKEFLRCWAVKNNCTLSSVSELLAGLKRIHPSCFSNLPSDDRTLLNISEFSLDLTKSDVPPGHYMHIGLEKQLKSIIHKLKYVPHKFELLVNIDGLPLFKSSQAQLYPILFSVLSVPVLRGKVFPIGLYYGPQKPHDVGLFLQDFVTEASSLVENGLDVKNVHVPVVIEAFTCDAPAKSYVLGIKGHGGYFSCTRCNVKGTTSNSRRVFLDFNCACRTSEEFLNWEDKNFRIRDTPLVNIPGLNFVNSFILDYMHLVCLGVVRTLLVTWVSGALPNKLSRQNIQQISSNLMRLKTHIPSEFVRKPRELNVILHWKATELRLFLLYLGPIVMKGILDSVKFVNFLTLHVAMVILLSPSMCDIQELRQYSRNLLRCFVQGIINSYGIDFITHNFHGLIHLVDDADHFVPKYPNFTLDVVSAFSFENYMQHLKRIVRGHNKPLEQIGNRLTESFSLPILDDFSGSSDVQMSCPHNCGPLLQNCSGPQYKKIKLSDYTLTTNFPNNCCVVQNEIVLIENFCVSRDLDTKVIIGRTFLEKKDFYSYPCKSSDVGIHKVVVIKNILQQMWTLVRLSDDDTVDIVPDKWIASKTSCWYPSNERLSTIKSWAKSETRPREDWEMVEIIIIEGDIGDYEKGCRMMVKAARHDKLHSENEVRGRGYRMKKRPLISSSSEDESIEVKSDLGKEKNQQKSLKEAVVLPPFPSRPIADKPQGSSGKNESSLPSQQATSALSQQATSALSQQATSVLTQEATLACCLLTNKQVHRCAFSIGKPLSLSAVAQQLCLMSADILKVKTSLKYLASDIEESKDKQPRDTSASCGSDDVMYAFFPMKDVATLELLEQKLKEEGKVFLNKLVLALTFAVEGTTISRVVGSTLRLMFDNNLAACYSWKGQKHKKALCNLEIVKIILGVVKNKFPNSEKQEIVKCIQPWLAQAPTRLQRSASAQNKGDELV